MKSGVERHYERLFQRYPDMEYMRESVMNAFNIICQAYQQGKKVMICGNGGSAADAEHIVGELMKGFYLPRKIKNPPLEGLQGALPALALTQHTALATAVMNDMDATLIFAQQVYGYGQEGDVLICISTSGNAENVIKAAKTACAMGIKVIGMTGGGNFPGGRLAKYCDVLLAVSADTTADVQELHLPLYHTLCAMLEAEFFG